MQLRLKMSRAFPKRFISIGANKVYTLLQKTKLSNFINILIFNEKKCFCSASDISPV